MCISNFNKTKFLYVRNILHVITALKCFKNGFQNVKKMLENVLKSLHHCYVFR